jgi:RNA polymerase sigma-70 factor (ECF subfamily)
MAAANAVARSSISPGGRLVKGSGTVGMGPIVVDRRSGDARPAARDTPAVSLASKDAMPLGRPGAGAMPAAATVPSDALRAAFEALARREAAALYRTARRLARPPNQAADLVQETLLRAYRTFASFQEGTNGRAWLFTILYSVAINAGRRAGAHREIGVDDVEADGAPAGPVRVDAEEVALLRRIDASPDVERALDGLPEAFRTAVWLVDVEELTYEEAAAVIECPVGTLRSRLFRGRRALFETLRGYARANGLLGREGAP